MRPLRQITGEAEFNELFIEEARIPDENVVGGVGNGWKVAITTLMNERAGLGVRPRRCGLRQLLDELIEEAAERGLPTTRSSATGSRELHIEAETLRLDAYRGLTTTMKYGQPGPEGSLGKWQWSDDQPGADRAARPTCSVPRRSTNGDRAGATASALARQLDRGRHHRDPQEHHRRAGARPAADALGDDRDELRLHRRAARDQAHRARLPRHALQAWRRSARLAEGGTTTTSSGARSASSAGPASRSPRSTAGRASASSSSSILLEELGYACARAPFLGNALAGLAIQSAGSTSSRRAGCPGSRPASARRGWRAGAASMPDGDGADVLVLVDGDGPRLVARRGRRRSRRVDADRPDPPATRASPTAWRGEPLPGDADAGARTSRAPRSPPSSSGSRSARWR